MEQSTAPTPVQEAPAVLAHGRELLTAAMQTGQVSPAQVVEAASALETTGRAIGYAQVQVAGVIDAHCQGVLEASGSRSTADFLRRRLHIGLGEAKRRIALAGDILPGVFLTGEPVPPRYETLAAAVAESRVDLSGAARILTALGEAQTIATGTGDRDVLALVSVMESQLTGQLAAHDLDFLPDLIASWNNALDPDGSAPGEEELRIRQGIIFHRAYRGITRIELHTDQLQAETIHTLIHAATNPRTLPPPATPKATAVPGPTVVQPPETAAMAESASIEQATVASPITAVPITAVPTAVNTASAQTTPGVVVDQRSRAQIGLDALIGAIRSALGQQNAAPTGGKTQLIAITTTPTTTRPHETPAPEALVPLLRSRVDGTVQYTGFIAPKLLNHLACDGDTVPVTADSAGRVLDVGRTQRLFTRAQRIALTARDKGCAFPDCTMPSGWCEAHHVTWWSDGGPTSVDNGVLLCSHHHHLIHQGAWSIHTNQGQPYFLPPPWIDPTQQPLQNHYHHPLPATG